MPWGLNDFRNRPLQLTRRPQISINGYAANNAPYNELVAVNGDNYMILDFGRDSVGNAAVAEGPANQIRVTGTRADGGGGNAYLLPWYADRICFTELGQSHDFFFTATVNGCAIMVSGGLCNPYVIHANTKSNQLTALDAPTLIGQYQGIYHAQAAAMAARGMADPANLRIFQPGDYMSLGTVFGVRTAGRWAFYSTAWTETAVVTRHFWP